MSDPISSPTCPDCAAPLPPESPQALCPACLMRQALASRTIVDGDQPAPASPPLSPEELGEKFPGYEILECLGRGGMGVVYKARQKSLNRIVAIKILAPERGSESRFAERFAREAELLAKLNHPHIVTIHDFGVTDSQPSTPDSQPLYYLVMEFVDGVNLRDLLRDGKLEDKQALAIVPPICEALQYAHDKGIVHRDIKPENLLLDRDGRVKIADFGIASLMGAGGESAGTPPYMAPEQSGGPTDHRADIYALGVVLYEMLTGERPAKDVVAPSRKVQVDVRLDGIVLRALEKMPELRYDNAGEFRTAVETIAKTPPPKSPASRDESAEIENNNTAPFKLIGIPIVETRNGKRHLILPAFSGVYLLIALIIFLVTLPMCLLFGISLKPCLFVASFGAMCFTVGGLRAALLAPANSHHPATAGAPQTKPNGRGLGWGFGCAVVLALLIGVVVIGAITAALSYSGLRTENGEKVEKVDAALAKQGFRVIPSAPFIAKYPGGTVEIVALANYPEEKFRYWLPNGSRTEEWTFPLQAPGSWVSGKKVRMMAVRVHSQSKDASPAQLRFEADSPHAQLGSSHYFDNPAYIETIQLFGADHCVMDIDVRIGVADGDWETVKTLNPSGNAILPDGSKQGSDSASISDGWESGVDRIVAADGSMTVSFRYSRHENYETRMVAVRADGSKQKIKSGSLNGSNRVMNGMATFTAEEAAKIVGFESQRRPYQWVTFKNVSVEPDHETKVEVKDSGAAAE